MRPLGNSSDGPKFQGWSRTLGESLDPDRRAREEERFKRVADYDALTNYLSALVKEKRKRPGGDVLSEAALAALAKRLVDPRLLGDPPPYRPGAWLRGPEHLMLGIGVVVP